MHSELNNGYSIDGIEAQMEDSSVSDPYLVSLLNNSQGSAGQTVSESMQVVFDELDTTATRRRAALLQGKP